MKTYEEFELSPFQIEMLKKANANCAIKKYIKKYGTAPENMEQFYTYTQKQYDAYKRIAYSKYASQQLMNENASDIPIINYTENNWEHEYSEFIYDGQILRYNQRISNNEPKVIKIGSEFIEDVESIPHGNVNKIIVSSKNKKFDSRDDCNSLIETSTNTLILGSSSSIIPNTITSIGNNAFSGCSGLTNISLPDSITSIGNNAFSGCSNLTEISLPNSITSIPSHCFLGCNLTSIIIPDSVTDISQDAFSYSGDCTITSITLPDSITGINWILRQLDNLTEVIYGGTKEKWSNSVSSPAYTYFGHIVTVICTDGVIVYDVDGKVLTTSVINYTSSNKLVETTSNDEPGVKINKLGTSLISHTFENGSGRIEFTGTSIGQYAFSGCTELTSITLSENITSIGGYAFSGCTGLTSITLPENITSIGDYAFENCSNLTTFTVQESNNTISIGRSIFYRCNNLSSINIPTPVQVSQQSFEDCSGLTSITITNSSYIPEYTFKRTGLTSITIPNGVTQIKRGAFVRCLNLTSVIIPRTVTSIVSSAFENCANLTITYLGTISEWVNKNISIMINETLYPDTTIQVICTDGTTNANIIH